MKSFQVYLLARASCDSHTSLDFRCDHRWQLYLTVAVVELSSSEIPRMNATPHTMLLCYRCCSFYWWDRFWLENTMRGSN